jgi:hypothetical protein
MRFMGGAVRISVPNCGGSALGHSCVIPLFQTIFYVGGFSVKNCDRYKFKEPIIRSRYQSNQSNNADLMRLFKGFQTIQRRRTAWQKMELTEAVRERERVEKRNRSLKKFLTAIRENVR